MRARPACAAVSPAAVFTLIAVTVGHTAYAQPEPDSAMYHELQRQVVEQIQAVQARDGAHSAGLIAPFTELALLYEESGDHVLAIAAIEQTLNLVRINRGLHSLDQAPLLQQAIRNEEALGDFAAAWDREQRLIELAWRHREDLRTVPILRDVADRRMTVFDRWMEGEYPAETILGGYCQAFGQIFVCEKHRAARQILADAQTYYADAIEVLLRNEEYASDELRVLEMELVRTSDLPRAQPQLADETRLRRVSRDRRRQLLMRTVGVEERERDVIADRLRRDPISTRLAQLSPRAAEEQQDSSRQVPAEARHMSYYRYGRLSLRRLYDYEVASSAPSADQLIAFIAIADWDLLYSRNSLALEGYEQLYAWLEGSSDARESIEELFSPSIPVVLPSFMPNPLASAESADSTGYIDVAFRITKYGAPRRIDILDSTTNATDAAKSCLVRLIRGSRFRPRVTEGELGVSPVVVRYYLNDAGPEDKEKRTTRRCGLVNDQQ